VSKISKELISIINENSRKIEQCKGIKHCRMEIFQHQQGRSDDRDIIKN
jgi:hypothetical protein